jgi:diguanylate cyclase (GGDEF)-like protein
MTGGRVVDRDDSTNAGQNGTGSKAPSAAADILSSVGTATYEWAIPSDRLTWSENAGGVLGIDARHLATGRAYAQMLAKESPAGRYEAIVNSPHIDRGDGVAYAIEYAIRGSEGVTHWVEDSGRWFASSDGRPLRAHGAVRVITESYETRRRLIEASEIDPMTGQLSRHRFCEVLESALEDAIKVRGSIGLLVAAVDNLAHVNEAYGFDIADEIIAAVGKRIRTRLRGGDLLGRLSGNKFGMLIRNCQPEDMEIAAERILNAVRDDVFLTRAGPVAITVTIGGIIAPRHADTLAALLGRSQEALDGIKARRRGAFQIYAPSLERERARQENLKTTDEIVSALNERRIGLAFQPIVTAGPERRPAYYECLLRIRRADGTLLPASDARPWLETATAAPRALSA